MGPWETHLAELIGFVRREGHARVPHPHVAAGFKLGAWVSAQRTLNRSGRLERSRAERLAAVPGWTWRVGALPTDKEVVWARLREFVRREGHARVNPSHVEAGMKLGKWVSRQRGAYRAGRLPAKESKALAALRGWTWDPLGDDVERALACLRAYQEREGHASPPMSHVESGFALGLWVMSKRSAYHAGRLGSPCITGLEAIPGWSWRSTRTGHGFGEGLDLLRQYAQREGHALVPPEHVEDGVRLGLWVGNQRSRFKAGVLAPARERALEAIPGWQWDLLEHRFERGLSALRRFVAREGHARVHFEHVEDGLKLGWWTVVKRRRHRSGRLAAYQVKALGAIPGWQWELPRSSQPSRVPAGTKWCSRCQRCRRRSMFYRNRRSKDGLAALCRDCSRDYQRAYAAARSSVAKTI